MSLLPVLPLLLPVLARKFNHPMRMGYSGAVYVFSALCVGHSKYVSANIPYAHDVVVIRLPDFRYADELPEFWLCYVESHLYKLPAVLYNLCVCIGEEAREVAKEVEGFTAAINGVLIFGN